MRRSVLVLVATTALIAACGESSVPDGTPDAEVTTVGEAVGDADAAATGALATVSPEEAAGVIEADPDGLVVLDVRTPEEFAEGHLDGAVLVDFYDADFRDQLAELDPDVPYVLYCRSGNRSGQALAMMDELGFSSVDDVDGGIVAWQAAGLPVVTE